MKVYITARLPEEVLAGIAREHSVEAYAEDIPVSRQKLLAGIEGKEGLLCTLTDRIDLEVMGRAPDLKVIANNGDGFDHIDIEAATRKGIPVTNTPGVSTDSVADITLALILATTRRLVEGDRMTRSGNFQFWAPFHFLGHDVSGKTLGIVGFGSIGKAVARRANGFDMKVIYFSSTRLEKTEEDRLGVSFAPRSTAERLGFRIFARTDDPTDSSHDREEGTRNDEKLGLPDKHCQRPRR